jgi:hypothetical protein
MELNLNIKYLMNQYSIANSFKLQLSGLRFLAARASLWPILASQKVTSAPGRAGQAPTRTLCTFQLIALTQAISAMGQSLHFDRAPLTSGLPPTPDILSARRHVSNVPKAEKGAKLWYNFPAYDPTAGPSRALTGKFIQFNAKGNLMQ